MNCVLGSVNLSVLGSVNVSVLGSHMKKMQNGIKSFRPWANCTCIMGVAVQKCAHVGVGGVERCFVEVDRVERHKQSQYFSGSVGGVDWVVSGEA
ncbi:hypothetical protein J6590_061328 [Homalodisca vitripennis]|nr:hypothetical protein J6590_061328 [Homalodisca vitripennis]